MIPCSTSKLNLFCIIKIEEKGTVFLLSKSFLYSFLLSFQKHIRHSIFSCTCRRDNESKIMKLFQFNAFGTCVGEDRSNSHCLPFEKLITQPLCNSIAKTISYTKSAVYCLSVDFSSQYILLLLKMQKNV